VRNQTRAALAAFAMSAFSAPAFADTLGILSPETIDATIVGSSEMIIHVPTDANSRAQTVAAIDVTHQQLVDAFPGSGQSLDMSGRDGSLRSCYANGGIAKQGDDLVYRCIADASQGGTVQAEASPYITPSHAETGYDGAQNVDDPALLDCMGRGGSLIQLSTNGQFACAM